MDQHPIPRQITTFEFKLIGFMTLRQFIYIVIFAPIGFIVYALFPIPILNVLLGVVVGLLGLVFAFVPINDRPIDVWIRNFIKKLSTPTQYFFYKDNLPIYLLKDLFFTADPHQVAAHIESQEKLAAYLSKQASTTTAKDNRATINQLLRQKQKIVPSTTSVYSATGGNTVDLTSQSSLKKLPFLTGVIKNHKLMPIPGVLIYIKDNQGKTVRLLKTNPHGVFATFNPLPAGEYLFEIKDPNNSHFFDTMKINIGTENKKPIEIFSRELI